MFMVLSAAAERRLIELAQDATRNSATPVEGLAISVDPREELIQVMDDPHPISHVYPSRKFRGRQVTENSLEAEGGGDGGQTQPSLAASGALKAGRMPALPKWLYASPAPPVGRASCPARSDKRASFMV